MAIFLPSAHALKRVVAGLGSELAPILSLEMAAGDVQATLRKHVTRKPVTVETCMSKLCFFFFHFVMLPRVQLRAQLFMFDNIDCEISCCSRDHAFSHSSSFNFKGVDSCTY